MPPRLPVQSVDPLGWGTILNDYLSQEHEADGKHKPHGPLIRVASASASERSKRRADIICDGVADDVDFEAAEALLPASGGIIQLTEGTYTLALEVVFSKPVFLRGTGPSTIVNGAAIVAGGAVERGAIQWTGSRASAVTTVTTNVVKGQDTIIVASAASLSVGQYIGFRSGNNSVAGERFHQVTSRPTYYKGELAQIRSIAGTTITLMEPTKDSYDAVGFTVEVDTFALLAGCGASGLDVQMSNDATHHCGLRFWYCHSPQIERCRSFDAEYTAFLFYQSRFGTMDRCHAARSNEGTVGYGFRLVSSLGCNVRDCTGEDNRHDTDAGGYGGNTYPDRNHNFIGCTATSGISHGHGDHSHAEYVNFLACHAIGCSGGFGKRSSGAIAFCTVTGGHAGAFAGFTGISVGEDFDDDQRCGNDLQIVHNYVDMAGTYGVTDITGLRVTCPTRNALFEGNTFKGHNHTGMEFGTYYHENLSIIRNTVYGDATDASVTGINVKNSNAAGNTIKGLKIQFNKLYNITGSAIRVETTSGTWLGTPYTDVFIEFNEADGHASPMIHCANLDADNLYIRFNNTRSGFLPPNVPSLYTVNLAKMTGAFMAGGNIDSTGAIEPHDMQVQTQSWNPPAIANTAGANFASTSITMTGVKVGETVHASLSQAVTEGCFLTTHVTAADTVRVTLWNFSATASLDHGNGTLRLSRVRS